MFGQDRIIALLEKIANNPIPGATQTVAPSSAGVKADQYTDGTDDHVQIQAAIDAVDAAGGGLVVIKAGNYNAGTITWKNTVSIRGEGRKTKITLKTNAGTLFKSEDFDTKQGSGLAFDGIAHVFLSNMTLDGGSQTASGQANYEDMHAMIKVYGSDLDIFDIRIDSAAELGIYTEHDDDWNDDGTFNTWEFGENYYSNIKIKNYGIAGWVNRGSHDSHFSSIYISSSDEAGVSPNYGLILESDGGNNYGAHGAIFHNVHVWGNHDNNAVWLKGANVLDGFIYAEGCEQSAIKIEGSSANRFRAFLGYCVAGVELVGASNGNQIEAVVESNMTGPLFQLNTSASNNMLVQGPGYGSPGGAVFDLSTGGTYTGTYNHFKAWHAYTGTIFAGTPNILDTYEAPPNFRTGLAKITGGGATQYGVPGAVFNGVGTSALEINKARYTPFIVSRPVTITAFQFEVTSTPASAANVRVGIYRADLEGQPSGAPVYDSGSVAVANGFTGLKTTTGLSVKLKPGTYLVVMNCDVALTVRTIVAPAFYLAAALGGAPMVRRFDVVQSYAAFPTPGTKWDTVITSSTGFDFPAAFQWTENA
jgi:hypothetical protein